MKDGSVLFKSGKKELAGDYLAKIKALFLAGLENKLAELFDEDIPFRASAVADNYAYSIYTTLY